MAIDKARLIGALRAHTRAMEEQSGVRLALSTLEACLALMAGAADEGRQAEPRDFEDLYAAYLGLAARIEEFLDVAIERDQGGAAEAKRRLRDREDGLERLRLDLAEARQRLENGQADSEREEKRLEAELQHLKAQLAAIPESVRERQKRFKALEQELEDLRAEERRLFPEERLEALETQRDELAQKVEHERGLCRDLENGIADLEAEQVALVEEEFPRLGSRALVLVREVLADLSGRIEARDAEIRELKRDADALSANLEALNTLRVGYQQWLDADRTPLETMIRTAGEPERPVLGRTLDPARISDIQDLLGQAEDILKRLDERVEPLVRACGTDVRDVRRRRTRAHD